MNITAVSKLNDDQYDILIEGGQAEKRFILSRHKVIDLINGLAYVFENVREDVYIVDGERK